MFEGCCGTAVPTTRVVNKYLWCLWRDNLISVACVPIKVPSVEWGC